MSVRVRDLEIALVLAREMKAAAARSVDASLRLDQLQEVFGVERLDSTERARIQTALQMAGLEPFPSLLAADPTEPIRFGASQAAGAAGAAGDASAVGGASAAVPDDAAAAPAEAPAPTFPTVGEFARSKLGGRSRRRFGVRRGDHVEGDAPLPPPEEEYAESNGHVPEADATHVHHEVIGEAEVEEFPADVEEPAAEVEEEPAAEVEEFPADVEEPVAGVEEPSADMEVPLDHTATDAADEEPEYAEPVADTPDEESVTAIHHAPDFEDHHEPHDDEREYIPLVPDHQVAYEPAPEPQPAGTRVEDVVAALLPAVAIPVIVTSVAGWRFGLPFVALSVIATGWLMSRRKPAGAEKGGLLATLRRTPAAVTALKTTALVTVLSIAAAVALAAVGKNDSSTKGSQTATPHAKKPQRPAAASKPATPPATQAKKSHRRKPSTTPTTPSTSQPPDPATQGLVRVPPQSSTPSTGTGPNGTGSPGAGSQPSTGTGTGTQTTP
ncbi:MAG: hypothetical protein QOE38_1590, partial [Thermoleophilaceae bacterium]|nr:hypothetical protein [Thermoleophilaceae bacterium]